MDQTKIVFIVSDDVRAVRACYEPDGKAEIFKTFDPHIAVDDLVVVPTATRHNFSVCKVTEVDIEIDYDNGPDIKWIADRINLDVHKDNLAREQEAIRVVQSAERQRKRDEIRAAMFANHEDKLKNLALINSDQEVTE